MRKGWKQWKRFKKSAVSASFRSDHRNCAGADLNEAVMNVIVTIKFVIGELINFCVPLIVIGFIAPSITKLGKNASRILGVAVLLAYVSVLAALGSMAAGYGLIPHLSIVSGSRRLKELPEIVFQLKSADYVRDECACIFYFDRACGNLDQGRDSDPAIRWIPTDRTDDRIQDCHSDPSGIYCAYILVSGIRGNDHSSCRYFKVVLIVMVGHFIWMAVLCSGWNLLGNNPWKL